MSPFDIVMFGYGDWHLWEKEGLRVRNAKLCLHLARSDRVRSIAVVSDPPAFSPSGTSVRKYVAAALRTMPLRARWREVSDKITVLDPPLPAALPHRFRARWIIRAVARFCADQGIRAPALWIANPCKVFPIGRLGESCVIFDAIDDWEAIPEYAPIRTRIVRGYAEVKERAHIIFTVSDALLDKFQGAAAGIVRHVPNAVDAEIFDPAESDVKRDPAGPLVFTYVGIIHARFDEELVIALARAFPDAIIRLIGPIWSEPTEARLKGLSNIQLEGFVHHAEIPRALLDADVLILPHRVDEASRSMSPLKLFEYLASGRPIVSTPVPPAGDFGDLVYLAQGPEAFIDQARRAMSEAGEPRAGTMARRRREAARRHTWTRRVETILDDMEAFASERDEGRAPPSGRG